MEFMVIGRFCWGTGPTERAALKAARNAGGSKAVKSYVVYRVPVGAWVDGMGMIQWIIPPDTEKNGEKAPVFVRKVGCK